MHTGSYISIHAPRGGSDPGLAGFGLPGAISIHAPRGGSDRTRRTKGHGNRYFNPRSPWGERLKTTDIIRKRAQNFNPRSPWGERLCLRPIFARKEKTFQSTLPVGGATDSVVYQIAVTGISIHAPRGGSDQLRMRKNNENRNFNPRSPWGERQTVCYTIVNKERFQSTLPVGGATKAHDRHLLYLRISIHAPRGGSDRRGY